jgi:hypothetical protein
MKTLKKLSVIGLMLAISACGNAPEASYDLRKSDFGQITDLDTENSYYTEAQKCSASVNITSSQPEAPLSSSFRACKSTSESGSVSVKIFSTTGSSQNICIFALQAINGLLYPIVANQYSNTISRFAYQCGSTNSQTGASANFGNLSLGGIVVVNQGNELQMANCLMMGNTASCAASFGIFYSKGTL